MDWVMVGAAGGCDDEDVAAGEDPMAWVAIFSIAAAAAAQVCLQASFGIRKHHFSSRIFLDDRPRSWIGSRHT